MPKPIKKKIGKGYEGKKSQKGFWNNKLPKGKGNTRRGKK